MGKEFEDKFFQARLYCIELAAKKNFNVNTPDTPEWVRIGVEMFRTGKEITPQALRTIDLRGGDAPVKP